MRRQTSISALVYSHIYPKPTANDPQNFSAYLAKHLIPEIRIETARFYGSLDSIEARYPGLNYTYPPHVARLSRFANHARLFKTFKQLRLTDTEVLDLVRWEGTLWARERFERDEDLKVTDTTGDGIKPWVPHALRPPVPAGIKKDVSFIVTGEDVKSTHGALVDSAVGSPSIGSVEDLSASEASSDEDEDDGVDEVVHEVDEVRGTGRRRTSDAFVSRHGDVDVDAEESDDETEGPTEADIMEIRQRYQNVPLHERYRRVNIGLLRHEHTAEIELIDDLPKEPGEDDTWLSPLPTPGRSLANILNTASSIRASEEAPTIPQPA